jgi:hypothetical protein
MLDLLRRIESMRFRIAKSRSAEDIAKYQDILMQLEEEMLLKKLLYRQEKTACALLGLH